MSLNVWPVRLPVHAAGSLLLIQWPVCLKRLVLHFRVLPALLRLMKAAMNMPIIQVVWLWI